MKTTSIAPVIVMREITRLLAVFPRPKYWPATDEEVARRWADIFDGLAEEQLTVTITQFIRGDHSFIAKPGQFRALAAKQPCYAGASSTPDDYHQWRMQGGCDASGKLVPCPICGRAWQWHPRLTLVHDHAKHRASNVPCDAACDVAKCVGTYSIPQRGAPERQSAGELWTAPDNVTALPAAPLQLPPPPSDEQVERAAIAGEDA